MKIKNILITTLFLLQPIPVMAYILGSPSGCSNMQDSGSEYLFDCIATNLDNNDNPIDPAALTFRVIDVNDSSTVYTGAIDYGSLIDNVHKFKIHVPKSVCNGDFVTQCEIQIHYQ